MSSTEYKFVDRHGAKYTGRFTEAGTLYVKDLGTGKTVYMFEHNAKPLRVGDTHHCALLHNTYTVIVAPELEFA